VLDCCSFLPNTELRQQALATAVPELPSDMTIAPMVADSIKYIISTKVGDGPTVLDDSYSLIDPETHQPKM
jgi:hypothetical protein